VKKKSFFGRVLKILHYVGRKYKRKRTFGLGTKEGKQEGGILQRGEGFVYCLVRKGETGTWKKED